MAFTREQVRESFERAGFDEHWQALNRHHTEAYPESNPTPGEVARRLVSRLMGPERVVFLGDVPNLPALVRKIQMHPEYCLEPVGVVER